MATYSKPNGIHLRQWKSECDLTVSNAEAHHQHFDSRYSINHLVSNTDLPSQDHSSLDPVPATSDRELIPGSKREDDQGPAPFSSTPSPPIGYRRSKARLLSAELEQEEGDKRKREKKHKKQQEKKQKKEEMLNRSLALLDALADQEEQRQQKLPYNPFPTRHKSSLIDKEKSMGLW